MAATGSHRIYGTRTEFGIMNYATHYSHPFVPKTSNYIDPIPAASPAVQAPLQPAYSQPVPTATGGIAYHKVYRQDQLLFNEVGDQTEYGYWCASLPTWPRGSG